MRQVYFNITFFVIQAIVCYCFYYMLTTKHTQLSRESYTECGVLKEKYALARKDSKGNESIERIFVMAFDKHGPKLIHPDVETFYKYEVGSRSCYNMTEHWGKEPSKNQKLIGILGLIGGLWAIIYGVMILRWLCFAIFEGDSDVNMLLYFKVD